MIVAAATGVVVVGLAVGNPKLYHLSQLGKLIVVDGVSVVVPTNFCCCFLLLSLFAVVTAVVV